MSATARVAFTTEPTDADPHRYQPGFGNRFASEAIPNVLPVGRNVPQKVKYDLYSEQLNGAAVISSRDAIQHVWMYRMRPSVAHGQVTASDANPHVSHVLPPSAETGSDYSRLSPASLPPTARSSL